MWFFTENRCNNWYNQCFDWYNIYILCYFITLLKWYDDRTVV